MSWYCKNTHRFEDRYIIHGFFGDKYLCPICKTEDIAREPKTLPSANYKCKNCGLVIYKPKQVRKYGCTVGICPKCGNENI